MEPSNFPAFYAIPSSSQQAIPRPGFSGIPSGTASSQQLGGPMPSTSTSQMFDDDDYSNEPPLLEELGVNFLHIKAKLTAVLMVTKPVESNIMEDSDMAGPLVFCLSLGFFLLLTGKLHFGYIYGFGMLGCLFMYTLVNLMADATRMIDMSRTFSVLGYCLLPIVLLSALSVILDLRGTLGAIAGVGAITWCTFAAARIFEAALGLSQHRYLIAYPAFLFYACFALITIF